MTNKGILYEIQINNYLINNYNNYYSFLWKDVPQKYINKLKLNNLSNEDDENDDLENYTNNAIDIGCDILMVNKMDDNDIIIIQCKNFLDKNICTKDLSGFSFLMAFSHIPVRGFIISNTDISSRIKYKLQFIDNIKFYKIPYIDNNIVIDKINIPYDYQLEAMDKFRTISKGILQMPCGMGKTFTSILISEGYNNIIILSPLRIYADQHLQSFTNYFNNYEKNLITMDGNRDLSNLIENKKDFNIYSSTYCSANIVYDMLEYLENIILIIDEFHNLSYDVISNDNNIINKIIRSTKINKKIFISATPKIYNIVNSTNIKEYNVDLYEDLFGKIEYYYNFRKAIENKYINNYRIIIPNLEIELDKFDFIYSNILYYGYKKCLVYCKDINEAVIFKNRINIINDNRFNLKILNEIITYKTSFHKRKKLLEEFEKDSYKISFLISIDTLNECINIPHCDSIYILNEIHNSINVIQRISRCLRIKDGKNISGIFLWCKKYDELNKIKQIIDDYDSFFIKKVVIKNKNIEDVNEIIESIGESVDESVEENIGESIGECIEESIEKEVDEIVGENVFDESVGGCIEESIKESIEESIEKEVDEIVGEGVDAESIGESVAENINENIDKENINKEIKILDILFSLIDCKNNNLEIIIDIKQKYWFKYSDLSKILGYKDYLKTLQSRINKENKKSYNELSDKKKYHPHTIFINESGLYSLLVRSNKPIALKFQKEYGKLLVH